MKTAGIAVSAVLFLTTAALAADPNRVQITQHGQEVEIAAPETGILQLQTRPDISSGTWLGTGWPVKTKSLIRTMQRQREFARIETLTDKDVEITDNAQMMIDAGRNVFRFETFGDEDFWGGTLKLHLAVAGSANGGVGPGLSPDAALQLGLKVDSEALPADLVAKISAGQVDLNNPATTLALLKLNAVVGLTGFFDTNGAIHSLGIQCALCTPPWIIHSAPELESEWTAGPTAI